MTSPLVKKIASALNSALPSAGVTESATLIRSIAGTRTPSSLVDGTNATTTSYACKGFVSTERHAKIGETLVETTDRVVCLVGASLPVTPLAKDKITIDGATQRIVDLEGSPAMWTCLCRA
jgi:hypothetical protein